MNSRAFQLVCKWGTAIVCVLQIWYLVLQAERHWRALSSGNHVLLVGYIVLCPIIWIHLMRKAPDLYLTAILVYCALGASAILIFPLAN